MGAGHSWVPENIDTQIRNIFAEYFNDGLKHLATPDEVQINANLLANEEYSWQMTENREKLKRLPVVRIDRLEFIINKNVNIVRKMEVLYKVMFDLEYLYSNEGLDEYRPGNMWIISPECFKYILLYMFDKGSTLAQDSFEVTVWDMVPQIASYNFLYQSILYEVASVMFEKFKFYETYEQKVESSCRILAYINGFGEHDRRTGDISYSKAELAELDIYTQYRQKMTKDLIFILEKNEILAGVHSYEIHRTGNIFVLMIPFATDKEKQQIKELHAKLEITQMIYRHTQEFLNSNDDLKVWKWRYYNYFSCNSIYPSIVLKAFDDFYKEKETDLAYGLLKEELQDASFYSKSLLQYYPNPLLGNFQPEMFKLDDNNKSTQILNLDAIYAQGMHMPPRIYCSEYENEIETRISFDLLFDIFQVNGSQFNAADSTWKKLLQLLGNFSTRLESILLQEAKRTNYNLIKSAGLISESLYEMFPQEHSSHEGERLFLLLIGCKRGGHHSQIYFEQAWELLKNYSFSFMKFQTLQIHCACVAKFFGHFLEKDEKLEKEMKQLLESRWKAEKVFMEFLIKQSLYEQNVSKEALESLRKHITKYPFAFLQAFVKTLLMFVYKLRTTGDIKQYGGRDGSCINVFIETASYYTKIKEMILSQERTHYFPSLNETSLLTIPEALLGMLGKSNENIPTEKLGILFGGDWGSVLSMQGRSRFVSYEKSSLKKIKDLGVGAQGNTVLVSTKKSPVQHAAKYFDTSQLNSQLIKNEITTLLSLQGNQHVVTLFGFISEDNKEIGILMEYCEGGSLFELIAQGKKYTGKEILFWTTQAASGLCYLHDNKITHRDVKPANMVLNSDHSILKIADLGIAKIIENTALAAKDSIKTYWFGTEGYNCEEAYTDEAYNPTVDVFALGRSIWHMIYRVSPMDPTVEETTKAGSLATQAGNNWSIGDSIVEGRSYPEVISISLEVWLFHIGMMVEGKEKRPNMEKVYEFFSQKSRENPTEPVDKGDWQATEALAKWVLASESKPTKEEMQDFLGALGINLLF